MPTATPQPESPLPDRLSAALRAATPSLEAGAKSVNTSISLFPADAAQVEAICAAVSRSGRRITTSQAIRLALRAVEIDGERFLSILDAMKKEDGRARRPA